MNKVLDGKVIEKGTDSDNSGITIHDDNQAFLKIAKETSLNLFNYTPKVILAYSTNRLKDWCTWAFESNSSYCIISTFSAKSIAVSSSLSLIFRLYLFFLAALFLLRLRFRARKALKRSEKQKTRMTAKRMKKPRMNTVVMSLIMNIRSAHSADKKKIFEFWQIRLFDEVHSENSQYNLKLATCSWTTKFCEKKMSPGLISVYFLFASKSISVQLARLREFTLECYVKGALNLFIYAFMTHKFRPLNDKHIFKLIFHLFHSFYSIS